MTEVCCDYLPTKMARRRKRGSGFTRRKRKTRPTPRYALNRRQKRVWYRRYRCFSPPSAPSRAERLAARNAKKEKRLINTDKMLQYMKTMITDDKGMYTTKSDQIIQRMCKSCNRRNMLFLQLSRLPPEKRTMILSLMSWKAQDGIYEALTTGWKCPKEPYEHRQRLLKQYVPVLLDMYRG